MDPHPRLSASALHTHHVEVEGPSLSTPVHSQQPFCCQLRGVWSQRAVPESKHAGPLPRSLSRAPAPPLRSPYLLSSGQHPSPTGCGLTSVILLSLSCCSAPEGRREGLGPGRPLSPASCSTPPPLSPLATGASGLGARVSGSQVSNTPSPDKSLAGGGWVARCSIPLGQVGGAQPFPLEAPPPQFLCLWS